MKTLALTVFFLLIINIFCFATDSLKVKKIEYWEEGNLVKVENFNENGQILSRIESNFLEFGSDQVKNFLMIWKYDRKNAKELITYLVKVVADSVSMYKSDIGYTQKVVYNDNDKLNESVFYEISFFRKNDVDTLNFKKRYFRTTFSIDSLLQLHLTEVPTYGIKYLYDERGNKIKENYFDCTFGNCDSKTIQNTHSYVYDSSNRLKSAIYPYKVLDKQNNIINKRIIYVNWQYDSCHKITVKEDYNGKKLEEKTLTKTYLNNKNQETSIEKYAYKIKKGKEVGEPVLQSKTINFYENDRLVKILYEDFVSNQKRTQELKYTFY